MGSVLILGANSEIAMGCASRFAKEGHNLVLAARKSRRLTDHCNKIIKLFKVQVRLIDFEVGDYASHSSFWQEIENEIDVVLVAIGHFDPKIESNHDSPGVIETLQISYVGIVSFLNLVATSLKAKKQGSIIAISSVAGERGRQSNMFYGSAKAGLSTYLSGLRNWLHAYNVHVATIKPGYVDTKMIRHLNTSSLLTASVEEVANAIYEKAYIKKRNIVYVKAIWRLIMLVIRCIPEPIFKRLKL